VERELNLNNIPGTVLKLEKMGGSVGLEFLDKVFYISDGIMLSQIREITGIDGTTLQNWLKRGWVPNPKNRMYSREQLSRIMIINMMRDTMQLSRVSYLLRYLNGDDDGDRIITESRLYDYVCKIIVKITSPDSAALNDLSEVIEEVTEDYAEPVGGAKRRLSEALRVIVVSYYAAMIKSIADASVDRLGADPGRKR
jgi:DNA-binding transcriptional MerR regulator